jgi:hypothetical protein
VVPEAGLETKRRRHSVVADRLVIAIVEQKLPLEPLDFLQAFLEIPCAGSRRFTLIDKPERVPIYETLDLAV